MHKRLIIFSIFILAALCGLTCLGYHAVTKWAQGLEGARLGEFVDVAELIRQDVKRKLDEFIQAEEARNYTDYLAYYVPETANLAQQQLPVVRSPLAGQFSNDLAYGYFQIEPNGRVVGPWQVADQAPLAQAQVERNTLHRDNIALNVVPVVNSGAGALAIPPSDTGQKRKAEPQTKVEVAKESQNRFTKGQESRRQSFPIESFQNDSASARVIETQRSVVASNYAIAEEGQFQQALEPSTQQRQSQMGGLRQAQTDSIDPQDLSVQAQRATDENREQAVSQGIRSDDITIQEESQNPEPNLAETVQIRIDPFVPMLVPESNDGQSIFGSQVFLLRRVQIEDRHIVQGFQLNESKLLEEIRNSAKTFMRDNMTFELCPTESNNGGSTAPEDVAYTAVLDFGFGDLLVYLKELDPMWIGKEIHTLRAWYFSTIAVVAAAVILALASFWHTTQAQVKLAQKKDDFISAVSHELRTPLTSIRMYAEMLENNWLTSKDKAAEYYRNMRQESERLTRLIENVLDFSRLQRGQKRYDFRLGDINACIAEVVTMMGPYAAQHGFTIETDFDTLAPLSFDRDAIAQIVVNLVDNAVKYAKSATDKIITIRTRKGPGSTIIEVEDHGPGVPHRHRKKVFEQFYRCVSQLPKQGAQVTGTGLGLALVKRFAEAHNGFVEVFSAIPSGTVFRVALDSQL